MDDLRDRLKRDPDYAQQAVRGYQSFGYRTRDSWSRERRVIAKAEWLPGPPVGNADGEPAGKADGGPEAVAEGPCATIASMYTLRFLRGGASREVGRLVSISLPFGIVRTHLSRAD